MKILYYSSTINGAGEWLQEAIESVVQAEKTEIYRNLESLSQRLRRPTQLPDVSILFANSRADFMDLLPIRDLLLNLRIILILPDGNKETITRGHTLFPRFLTYANSDFKDVAAVLKKMIQKTDSKQSI
jgi:hypothetical protein